MSNNNQNIIISSNNISGKCDLKCSYTFKYPETNLTAKNNGSLISLTSDNSTGTPVTYNTEKYTVSNILIVCPSIHDFNNGQPAAAEIIIEHSSSTGGGPQLFVGIPITESSESSDASNYITQIIESVSSSAPASGETTNINISDFSLDKIVPKKPFFSYVTPGTLDNWIVFPLINAIPLSSSTLSTLSQVIQPFPLPTPASSNELFFNSGGPGSAGSLESEGIYISCQPTGSSEDETPVSYNKNSTSFDLATIFNSPIALMIFQIFMGCIIFITIFLILNYGFNSLTNTNIRLPNVGV
jgi:hypothetical protein